MTIKKLFYLAVVIFFFLIHLGAFLRAIFIEFDFTTLLGSSIMLAFFSAILFDMVLFAIKEYKK